MNRYSRRVAAFAPPTLDGRGDELAELADFCRAETGTAYAYWQGPAWTGKSALMAWFVLHPPPGVRVVSFFVTSRFAGQDDGVAFAEAVTGQLDRRDGPFPELLRRAARTCAEAAERLVLVVDGLGHYSTDIVALLPADPPAGMRVILSGRRLPVPPRGVVRQLAPSPAAQAIRAEAEPELARLLRGEPIEQSALGLLLAAGGGLSSTDLAQLTGRLTWEIDERLAAVARHTLQAIASPVDPGRPEGFVLAHDELHRAATVHFGPERLAGYAARITEWAETFRKRGWPRDTPDYLLGAYFDGLRTRHDLAAMLTVATDRRRQDRIAALTASDATAMTELAACLTVAAARPEPDLAMLARPALQRDFLHQRNGEVPSGRDVLLHLIRAGDLRWPRTPWEADRGPHQLEFRQALLAELLIENEEPLAAAEIAESITVPQLRERLVRMLDAAAWEAGPAADREGETVWAAARDVPQFTSEELAGLDQPLPLELPETIERAGGIDRAWWLGVVEVAVDLLVAAGRSERAIAFLERVVPELEVAHEFDREDRFALLMLRAHATDAKGALPMLRDAVREAEAAELDSFLEVVARAAAHHRYHVFARALAKRAGDMRPAVLAGLAVQALRQDLPEVAAAHWAAVEAPAQRAQAMLEAAVKCVADGQPAQARSIAANARVIADLGDLPAIDCVLALCDHDDERAVALLALDGPVAGVVAAELAGRWAERGDTARAEALWRSRSDSRIAARVAGALAARGDVDGAIDLAVRANAFGEHEILGRAAARCVPADARRLLAAAFQHGYWEPAARAVTAWEPGFATVVADEVARLMGAHATR